MSIHCTDCQKLYRTHKAHDAVHRSQLISKDEEIAKLQRKLIYKQAECERARAATKVVDQRWRKRMEATK